MIHILGAGALGLLWAARLAAVQTPCCLLLRPSRHEQWRAQGTQLQLTRQGQRHQFTVQTESVDQPGDPIDVLIVATKAYAVAQAMESVASRLQPDASIVLLQNGMGSQEKVVSAFPEQRVLYGSVTDGAWVAEPGHVVWAGEGSTVIGDPNGKLPPPWLHQLSQAKIDWQWEPHIHQVLWRKLAINCAINPLTVLHDCLNGEVAAVAPQRLSALLGDLQPLLAANGVELSHEELGVLVYGVIERTRANSSSMRQDVKTRRRTEISYILGFACDAARRKALPAPALDALLADTQQHLQRLGLPVD